MNSRRISLLLLAANVSLLCLLAYMVYAMKFTPAVAPGPVRSAVITNTVTQIAVRKINATNNLLAALAARPLHWRALESTNYVTYIENLRGFGCPEETVRDIIITDIAKLYARRRAELRQRVEPYRFWQTADPAGGVRVSPELQRQLRDLEAEQRQLVRDLLDVDLRTELARYSADADSPDRDYSFLPADKQERVQALAGQYDELEQDIYSRTRGLLLDEDLEALKQVQRQRRAELAALLTPEEMEEYELRHSDTANNIRTSSAGFQPTEEEFRKIFRLQRTFDLNFDQTFDARDDSAQSVKARAQQQAQAALNDEIRKSIGPERFAEYQRGQDSDYRALLLVGERFEMAGDATAKVYNMKQAAEQYKLQLESNPNLTDEQRAQAIAAIARETGRAVATTMGDEAYRAYQKAGGQWLDNLTVLDERNVPPSTPPQPPPNSVTIPDINLLPPDIRAFLLNPPIPPQPLPAK
jgi:hypothetical protein